MAARYLSHTSGEASSTESHTCSRFHCASLRLRACGSRGSGSGIRRSETRSQLNNSTNASNCVRRVFASVKDPTRAARLSSDIFPRSFAGNSANTMVRGESTFRPSLLRRRYGNRSFGRHPPCISRRTAHVQSSRPRCPCWELTCVLLEEVGYARENFLPADRAAFRRGDSCDRPSGTSRSRHSCRSHRVKCDHPRVAGAHERRASSRSRGGPGWLAVVHGTNGEQTWAAGAAYRRV